MHPYLFSFHLSSYIISICLHAIQIIFQSSTSSLMITSPLFCFIIVSILSLVLHSFTLYLKHNLSTTCLFHQYFYLVFQVESTQSMIRIVGLSATLPNYIDVARFLHVNPMKGLFFFDERFRPVPLQQTFIGIKGANYMQTMQRMEEVCYDKVLENVEHGHQVSHYK